MITLRDGLLAGALFSAASAGLWGWTQQHQVATAKEAGKRLEEQRDRAQQDRDQNLATANQLKSELARERDSQAKLLALQGELRQGLAQRERVIEALKHENQQLREWADQPLPDAARRLRERPPSPAPTLIVSGCPVVVPCQLPATAPTQNGNLLTDQERTELAWAECAAQVDRVYQHQVAHEQAQ